MTEINERLSKSLTKLRILLLRFGISITHNDFDGPNHRNEFLQRFSDLKNKRDKEKRRVKARATKR